MSVRVTASATILLSAAACAVNPATGEREFSLVSEQQEIARGREADPQITASLGLVEDDDLQAYVSGLGMRLAAVSERPDLPWSFKVVDDPVVNAFALPGGFIYVTRGILARFASEAELAGVLGHEIGHVTARHSASQMSRQQLQQIGLGVGMILSEDVRRFGGVLGAGLQLLNLSYSRGDETQSDELGLRYISRLDYDPDAMIGVFQMLADAGSGGDEGRVPEWSLTHPYPENREQNIREEITRTGVDTDGRLGVDEYLSQLDGLVYGEDPRQGFFEDTRFLHPELEFELVFPSGWQTVNQRTVVAAVAPSETAVMTLQVAQDVTDPVTGLRDFLGQEGMTGGSIREDEERGVRSATAEFQATTQDGTLRGEAAFLRHGETTYALIGYAAESNWPRHASEVGASISSFRPLTDQAALSVQPLRLDIVELPDAMSLASYLGRNPGPIELDEIARLNRRNPNEVLPAGTSIKVVVGARAG
jgi:predicted Zn-dependent protease